MVIKNGAALMAFVQSPLETLLELPAQ